VRAIGLSLIGLAKVHRATPSAMTAWEDGANDWSVVHRTLSLDSWCHVTSTPANSRTVFALLAVVAVVFRKPHERG